MNALEMKFSCLVFLVPSTISPDNRTDVEEGRRQVSGGRESVNVGMEGCGGRQLERRPGKKTAFTSSVSWNKHATLVENICVDCYFGFAGVLLFVLE